MGGVWGRVMGDSCAKLLSSVTCGVSGMGVDVRATGESGVKSLPRVKGGVSGVSDTSLSGESGSAISWGPSDAFEIGLVSLILMRGVLGARGGSGGNSAWLVRSSFKLVSLSNGTGLLDGVAFLQTASIASSRRVEATPFVGRPTVPLASRVLLVPSSGSAFVFSGALRSGSGVLCGTVRLNVLVVPKELFTWCVIISLMCDAASVITD